MHIVCIVNIWNTNSARAIWILFEWRMEVIDKLSIFFKEIEWNLFVTTASMIQFITCDLFSNVF